MKTPLSALTLLLLSILALHAQQPAPTPPGPPTALAVTSQQRAAVVSVQLTQAINTLVVQLKIACEQGLPADSAQAAPAVSAEEMRAAFGSENIWRLQGMVGALNANPSPALSQSAASASPKNGSCSPD